MRFVFKMIVFPFWLITAFLALMLKWTLNLSAFVLALPIHPVDIYRIGQDDPAKLRGWKKYVFPIYTAYNGKCRKDALPMKF